MEMALAMNVGTFEESYGNVIQGPWTSLSDDELFCVDGGRNWVATVAGTVCGVATIVGGVCLLLTPEPTTLTKVGGYAAVTAGAASIVWAWA